ncbi:MAG: UDP-N-acetylmuramate dehydrogenase [Bacteroidetes bacterium]|nr:UDP-N-acetylmuramate dehydrogenase [Bacteroidota bacterium]
MESFILNKEHIQNLHSKVSGAIRENVDLASISRWKIGGIADCIVQPSSTHEVATIIQYFFEYRIPYIVIGSTSNLLFADEGLRVPCIQIGSRMSKYSIQSPTAWAQAGVWIPFFARNVAKNGLSGIEHTAGIPGTLGGLIYMNGGSQRKGIGDHINTVTAVSSEGFIKKFNKNECEFEYRASAFQHNGFLITEATLSQFKNKKYSLIREDMLKILESRRKKFPNKLPNCGSTFISNPKMYDEFGPPGKIIEDLGLKGLTKGGATVSKIHGNFINNEGGAKSSDVIWLIRTIQNEVYRKTNTLLKTEVKYINEYGLISEIQ